jgi:hypothetical protein
MDDLESQIKDSSRPLKGVLWISKPTATDVQLLRSVVNVSNVVSAWIHTGSEMQQEPCQFRLVLEVDLTCASSSSIASDIKHRAKLQGFSINAWCIPVGQIDQFPWLIKESVHLI